MKLIAFSLLDMKTGHFNTPFFMNHTGAALRAVMDLGADLNTTVGRHPADFVLAQIGEFDDQTGQMEPMVPLHLGTVLSLLPRQAPDPSLFSGLLEREAERAAEASAELRNGRA